MEPRRDAIYLSFGGFRTVRRGTIGANTWALCEGIRLAVFFCLANAGSV